MFCTRCGADVSGAFCPACGTPAGGTTPGPALDYAQWPTRALGYLVDGLLVLAVMAAALLPGLLLFGFMESAGHGLRSEGMRSLGGPGLCLLSGLIPLAAIAIGIYNKVCLVAQRGASVGQGVVKIKVVDARGKRLSLGTAFVRFLVHVGIGFLPLGSVVDLLWPLWDERRQTLHDKAVSCYVVNNRS